MPEALKRLIESISHLPWIGEKTATRLAFFLLKAPREFSFSLADAVRAAHENVHECPRCHGYASSEGVQCTICQDSERDENILCIVEDYLDMLSIERVGAFQGRYHVLWGVISPLSGVSASDLTIDHLLERISEEKVTEVILAVNPTVEGDVTCLYLQERLPKKELTVSRLSKGLPNAGAIEYADEVTILSAFRGRSRG